MNNLKLFKIIGFLKGLYFYVPIISLFLLAENVSLSAIVISQVFYSIFTFISEVPTGILADKFGQKTSIIIGYIIEAAGILLVILFPTTIGLYIAFSLRGFANSFLSGSEEALIYESAKHEKKKYSKVYGEFLSNEQIGFVLSAAFAGTLYHFLGSQAFMLLIILTAIALLAAGFTSILLTEHSDRSDRSSDVETFSILKQSFLLIFKHKTIFTLTLVSVFTLGGKYFLQSVYQPYFESNMVPAFWIGAVLSVGTTVSIFVKRYIHIAERYLTLEKILLILNLTLGVAYILMSLLVHPLFLIGLFIVMYGLFNVEAPIISHYINSHTQTNIRTTVLSGVSFFKRFFQVLITLGLGLSVEVFGAQTSLLIQGTYLIVGIFIGYLLLVNCGCIDKVNKNLSSN